MTGFQQPPAREQTALKGGAQYGLFAKKDDGVFVRMSVWLLAVQRAPNEVQARTLSQDGVFLEFTDSLNEDEIQVIAA